MEINMALPEQLCEFETALVSEGMSVLNILISNLKRSLK